MEQNNKCASVTKKGDPCKNKHKEGSLFCGIHDKSQESSELKKKKEKEKKEDFRIPDFETDSEYIDQAILNCKKFYVFKSYLFDLKENGKFIHIGSISYTGRIILT